MPCRRVLTRVVVPLLVALLAGLSGSRSLGADPQPYTVTLKPTGDSALDGVLHDSSTLVSLQASAPSGGFALTERARQDAGRFATAMQGFGYYKAQVTMTLGGRPLSDPMLVDTIDAAPGDPPLPVVVAFDLGPRFQLGQVRIDGAVPPGFAARLGLSSGQPAIAADVLAARDSLLAGLRGNGYALAKVTLLPASLRPDENLLDVTFQVDPGMLVNIGAVSVGGLQDMNESFVRQRLLLHPGERFNPGAIEAARQDLAAIGVFSVVRAEPAEALDGQGNLPVRFDVTERPLHAVDLGAAYSTDLGINFTAGWHHRNLFGNAEQLNLTGAFQLGGNAETKPGYQANAQFIKPDFLARDQALELDFGAIKQSLEAYDQIALVQKVALNRKFSPHWSGSLGLSGEQEQITQEGVVRHYNLAGLPASVRYDSTTSQLDPVSGVRATVSVTPTEALSRKSATFFILQAAGSTYFDLRDDGRSVLALRGLVGQASGVGVFGLPPDQRFYAGGSGTVRGYRYQSIGPHFADNRPAGGTAVATGGVEIRQRILDKYGVVAFVDTGQVTTDGAPFTGTWRAGAGIGARYYTPIGPIRLDVAVPLTKQPGGDTFELYIGIGQAF